MERLNLQWFDAMAAAGSQFSPYAQASGWTKFMRPNQIAALQRPGGGSTSLCKAIASACDRGVLASKKVTVKSRPDLSKVSLSKYLASTTHDVTVLSVNAIDFSVWLATLDQAPSKHILAWIAATVPTSATTPAVVMAASERSASESREQRQDRRLKACEDSGLVMPLSSAGRLPDGVGKVAATQGVKRQPFSMDVKAALKRRERDKREGVVIRRS